MYKFFFCSWRSHKKYSPHVFFSTSKWMALMNLEHMRHFKYHFPMLQVRKNLNPIGSISSWNSPISGMNLSLFPKGLKKFGNKTFTNRGENVHRSRKSGVSKNGYHKHLTSCSHQLGVPSLLCNLKHDERVFIKLSQICLQVFGFFGPWPRNFLFKGSVLGKHDFLFYR